MNTKTTLKEASQSTTRDLVQVAKSVPVGSKLSLDASGRVLIDGEPSEAKNLAQITNLLSEVGSATGESLRTQAVRHFAGQAPDAARKIGIVVENRGGRKKVFTQTGMKPLDGLSEELVQVGGVYMTTISQKGFALVDPEDEIPLTTGRALEPHFGRVPGFVFDAVWDRIREREASQKAVKQEAEAQVEEDSQMSALTEGGKITLGQYA